MLNKRVISYIVKVLEEGYPSKQVEDVLLKKGFKEAEVKEGVSLALQNIRTNKGLKNKVEKIFYEKFLNKTDKLIADYAERKFNDGHFRDQIEKTLIDEGYDIERVARIVSIVEKKVVIEKKLHSIFDSIAHLKDSPTIKYEVQHHEWIKLGFVISVVALGLMALLFRYGINIVEWGSLIAGLAVALPLGAYSMHHISIRMHFKEGHFKQAFAYLLLTAMLLTLSRAFFSIWAMLAAVLVAIWFVSNFVMDHFEFPKGKAYILTSLAVAISLSSAYIMMAAIGLLIGLYQIQV